MEEAIYPLAILAVVLFPIARRHVRNYLLRPLRLRRRPMYATLDYIPFDPADVPEPVAKALALASQQFAACGYRAIDHLTSRTHVAVAGATKYMSVWWRDDYREMASIAILAIERPRPQIVSVVSIGQAFTDESSIVVSTERFPRSDGPGDRRIRLPEIWDIALLCEVQRRWTRRDTGDRIAQVVGPGQMRQYMTKHLRAGLERLVARGWCRFDPQDGGYYYTLRGAVLTIWGHLWPLKPVRERRDRREAEQLLRSLGFGGIDDLIRRQRPLIHDEAGGASVRIGGFPVAAPVPVESTAAPDVPSLNSQPDPRPAFGAAPAAGSQVVSADGAQAAGLAPSHVSDDQVT